MPIPKLDLLSFCSLTQDIYLNDLILDIHATTKLHTHGFFEVFIVLEGSFIHTYNGQTSLLTKGMGQFIRPCDQHFFKASALHTKNSLRNIAFSAHTFKNFILGLHTHLTTSFFEPFEVTDSLFDQFKYKTDKLFTEHASPYRSYITQSLISDLAIYSLDHCRTPHQIPHWLQHTYQAMQSPEAFVLGLPKLLALSARSHEHVTRAFVQHYHQTPTAYINTLRLKESARLLIQTDYLIIVIAETCGFDTLTYYNKLFKAYYGMSPSSYRSKYKRALF